MSHLVDAFILNTIGGRDPREKGLALRRNEGAIMSEIVIAGDSFSPTALVDPDEKATPYNLGDSVQYQRLGRHSMPEAYSMEMGKELIQSILESRIQESQEDTSVESNSLSTSEERGIVSWWKRFADDDETKEEPQKDKDERHFRCVSVVSRYRITKRNQKDQEDEENQEEKKDNGHGRASLNDTDDAKSKRKVLILYNATRSEDYWSSAKEDKKKDRKDKLEKDLEICQNAELVVLRTTMRSLQSEYQLAGALLANSTLAKKTVAIVSIESIRRAGFNVRRSLSWEQVIREVMSELWRMPGLGYLKALVVTSHREGCLTIIPDDKEDKSEARFKNGRFTVWYVPNELEGSYDRTIDSLPMASLSLVAASIAYGAASVDNLDQLNIAFRAACGISAARKLLKSGFVFDEASQKMSVPQKVANVAFKKCAPPSNSEVGTGDWKDWPYMQFETSVQEALVSNKRDFSILRSAELKKLMGKQHLQPPQRDLARNYVLKGKAETREYPCLQVGNLLTYDRGEIEQLNNLRNNLNAYLKETSLRKPLSICVFGRPGAGKSFAVKEIASSLKMNRDAFLEFNLSQMEDYRDLIAVFHRIADVGHRGVVPLVFFDEFDSKQGGAPYGWLKYFLAPMQDGLYRDGDAEYYIGRTVFVFAGGTCPNHSEFVKKCDNRRA